jgi:hypothetical protein
MVEPMIGPTRSLTMSMPTTPSGLTVATLPADFFSAECLGCVSSLGRNTSVAAGYWAADTSIFKNFTNFRQISCAVPPCSLQCLQPGKLSTERRTGAN